MKEAPAGRDRLCRIDKTALLRDRQQDQRDPANDGANAPVPTRRDLIGVRAGVTLDNGRSGQRETQVVCHGGNDLHDEQFIRRQSRLE